MAVRMKIVLMLDEGASYNDIKEKLDTTAPTISLWKRRYREEGLVGLATFHPGQPPKKLTAQLRAKILAQDAAGSAGWVDPLVAAQNGGAAGSWQRLDPAGLAGSGVEAASAGSLHGQ